MEGKKEGTIKELGDKRQMKMTGKRLLLDPKGYFIIRTRHDKIEIGFCRYNDMVLGKYNKVLMKCTSKNPQYIMRWIRNNKLTSREDHYVYLTNEVRRAKECVDRGVKYVQD